MQTLGAREGERREDKSEREESGAEEAIGSLKRSTCKGAPTLEIAVSLRGRRETGSK